jgi:hypothetical protein
MIVARRYLGTQCLTTDHETNDAIFPTIPQPPPCIVGWIQSPEVRATLLLDVIHHVLFNPLKIVGAGESQSHVRNKCTFTADFRVRKRSCS